MRKFRNPGGHIQLHLANGGTDMNNNLVEEDDSSLLPLYARKPEAVNSQI